MFLLTTAAVIDRSNARPPQIENKRSIMSKSRSLGAAIAFAVLTTAALAAPANAAVVACKTDGVPKGCVVRAAPVVVTPVVRPIAPVVVTPVVRPIPPAAAAVRVTRVGYAVGGPVVVRHAGYTRVTPWGVRHVGVTRVWR
jgi:hypothetical protein